MKDEISYLQKFWNHIKGIPENTEYDVSIDENTTITKTIVDHIKDIYSDIRAFVGGSSSIKGKDDVDLIKVEIEGETGIPTVTMSITNIDDKKKALDNTQIATKEYVDQKQTNVYDGRYIAKSSTTSNSINVDKQGSMANFSTNGQAYLAVRPKTGAEFLPQIQQPYAGAAFGVKLDGTAAFSHKTYTTYNASTGAYTGARNTAVLQYAGPIGLRYAKNTGTSSDVTEDMYKYVGVIDSPDDFQRVYSAQQVDDIINPLIARIEALEVALGINNNETT